MSFSSGFFDSIGSDRTYNASDFSEYLSDLVSNGCLPNNTGLKVSANADLIGSNPPSVIIAPGKAFMDGQYFRNDAPYIYYIGASQNVEFGLKHLIYLSFDNSITERQATIKHVTHPEPVIPMDTDDIKNMPLALIEDKQNVQPRTEHITDMRWMAGVTAFHIPCPYPIGSFMFSSLPDRPELSYPGTTWKPWGQGRVPVGVDTTQPEFDNTGLPIGTSKSGGTKTHTLKVTEMPSHNHTLGWWGVSSAESGSKVPNLWRGDSPSFKTTSNTGGGQPHNNLQPYFTCYMWIRVS